MKEKIFKNNLAGEIRPLSIEPATTLVELMIVMGIMVMVTGSIVAFLMSSDVSWKIGQNKLAEQQQARIAMADIVNALKYSSPNWVDSSSNNYPVTLGTARIDFYIPVFYQRCCPDSCADSSVCLDKDNVTHGGNEIAELTKVTYKRDPSDSSKLLKKQGTSQEQVIANDISSIVFSSSRTGCGAVSNSCPFVDITVTTQKETQHTLQSEVALKNQSIILSPDVEIEEPEEGEF